MAVMDLYNSLTDEQQERLRSCASLAEMYAVIKEEDIVLTEDHWEAIYGRYDFGRKNQRANAIETGLFDRFIVPSEEWRELLCQAEANERAIRSQYPSAAGQESAACELIAGENEMLWLKLLTAENTRSFLEFCLKLRGGCSEARQRRLAREQARLLEYLADGAPIPDSAGAVLSLWETANRLEPRWYDDLPAHFRTPGEHIPFAHGRNPLQSGPAPVGFDTSPPEEIPEAIARLLEWVHRQGLPRELAAFASVFLLYRIHPFPDGNGHTARMLCCGMLAPAYSAVTLSAFLSQMFENRRSIVDAAILADVSNGDLTPQCCTLMRLLIRGQKRLLSRET